MIAYSAFLNALFDRGVDTALSLPCSSFSGVLHGLATDQRFDHIAVTSEAEAVGIAAGAWMAGRKPAVLIQNSGFCDALNPIASLLRTFAIPVLFFVSVRGGFGKADEPQHDLIGRKFMAIVESFELPGMVLDADRSIAAQLSEFESQSLDLGLPGIIAVPTGTIEMAARGSQPLSLAQPITQMPDILPGPVPAECGESCGFRADILSAISRLAPPDALLVCSTGHIGRELYALGDRENYLYVVGSMGCASAVGFAISRYCDRPVIVLDGDGAVLMRMGNLATIANAGAGRLIHVVMNNGTYESTGGQINYARQVDFSGAARACGYAAQSQRVASMADLERALTQALGQLAKGSPVMIDTIMAPVSPAPTVRPAVTPPEQAQRIRQLLSGQVAGSRILQDS